MYIIVCIQIRGYIGFASLYAVGIQTNRGMAKLEIAKSFSKRFYESISKITQKRF